MTLKEAIRQLRQLYNLTEEQVNTISAILLLDHYGHAVPNFPDKELYIAEIEKNGAKLREVIKRRKQLHKQKVHKFMDDNLMVR
jgi:hypothetical protein